MSSTEGPIALPDQIQHIGVVVKDIEATTKFLSSMWGMGPWDIFDYTGDKDKVIFGEPFSMKIAFAKLGPTQVELLQPLDDKSLLAKFLQTNGEGLHHISYDIPNYDEMVANLEKHGCQMLAAAFNDDGTRWCYFDTRPGGIVVEFEEP
jgi:methylmalonyl-CoA/ethylmalonyl-CoA epimerase